MVLRWQPDTCKCILEFGDGGNSGTPIKADKCGIHAKLSLEELGNVIRDENTAKNRAMMVATLSPSVIYTLNEDEKRQLRMLQRIQNPGTKLTDIPDKIQHPDKEADWSFDENRKIILSLSGYTREEKTAIEAEIEEKIGGDKIILEDKTPIVETIPDGGIIP
jgi:hypothetical protein